MTYFPARWTLLLVWAALMLLTLGTMVAGKVVDGAALGLGWMVALAAITLFKARLILSSYLNLRTAPVWLDTFTIVVALILIVVLAIFALGAAHV